MGRIGFIPVSFDSIIFLILAFPILAQNNGNSKTHQPQPMDQDNRELLKPPLATRIFMLILVTIS